MSEPVKQEAEVLAGFRMMDGTLIEFKREGTKLIVCRDNLCLILPRATGRQTLDLAFLLGDYGKLEDKDADSE